ncbi:MAG: hypothetical protein ACOZNI_31310 [Myxococcota bacterium]
MLIVLLAAAPALAQEWDVVDDEHDVTLSLSALHLMVPMVEATAEFRVSPARSVAVIGGIGGNDGFMVWDVGGQARQYFIGDFDTGLNVGAEAKWETADYLTPDAWDYPTTGRLAAGPFIGAKLTLALFTLEAQGGGQFVWQPGGDLDLGPLLNVNAGVSF